LILYRCRTPTNWLCRCGTVARALKRGGWDYEQVRVAQRRKQRYEIHDLTGQDWVPVLVDGEEVIHDSHRILEYLRNRDGSRGPSGPTA
jgi:glutathione S-transferase